ncbi:MAG: twin-arginine translocase TatA/TatE family subunit [Rectinemataceae bacterium]|jgi:sec-independent protein translocase protein TatA
MPFGLQPIHLLVVAFVALIIFGPRRLPQLGRWIGRTFTEFRKGSQEMSEGIRDEIAKADEKPSSPSAADPPRKDSATGNFCVKCGAPNPPDARFCNKCGSPIPS